MLLIVVFLLLLFMGGVFLFKLGQIPSLELFPRSNRLDGRLRLRFLGLWTVSETALTDIQKAEHDVHPHSRGRSRIVLVTGNGNVLFNKAYRPKVQADRGVRQLNNFLAGRFRGGRRDRYSFDAMFQLRAAMLFGLIPALIGLGAVIHLSMIELGMEPTQVGPFHFGATPSHVSPEELETVGQQFERDIASYFPPNAVLPDFCTVGHNPGGPTVNESQFFGTTRLGFDAISSRIVNGVRESHWQPVDRIVQDNAIGYLVTDGTTEMSYTFSSSSTDGIIDCTVTWKSTGE